MAKKFNAIFVAKTSCSPALIEEVVPQLLNCGFDFGRTSVEAIITKIKEWTKSSSGFDGFIIQNKGHEKIWPKCEKISLSSLIRDNGYKKIDQIDFNLLDENDLQWLEI